MKHRSRYVLALFLALWLPACDAQPSAEPSPLEWVQHESGFELAACYVPARDAVHCMVRNATEETLECPLAWCWALISDLEVRTNGEEEWTALREERFDIPAGSDIPAGLVRPVLGCLIYEDVAPGEYLRGEDVGTSRERPISVDLATILGEPVLLGASGELLAEGFSLPLSAYALPREVDGPLELRVTSLIGGDTKHVFPVVTRSRSEVSTVEAP